MCVCVCVCVCVEGVGLLELQCTFFGGILVGGNCCWVVILGSGSAS